MIDGGAGTTVGRVIVRCAAGLFLVAAGGWALIEDIPVGNVVWYVPAWYGYLLVLDAAMLARSGRSFIGDRRRELAAMLFWSLPFWFFFEACNFVLRDWYYVFALRSQWASALMAALAFATVLPACFFHAELFEVLGAWKGKMGKALVVTPLLRRAVGAAAVGCVALPLLLPRVAFPLVWFAPIGLEAVNHRNGSPSLLRDLEQGRPGRLLRLLVGGAWAGVVWELVNAGARCKWIYTVPGFEGSKLFEMPLAGFLGFPVFALGAFSFYSFATNLRTTGWRQAARLAALGFCVLVQIGVERWTVRSRRPLLTELGILDPSALERLREAGVPTPELLSRAMEEAGVDALSRRVGLPASVLAPAAANADLAIHKGLGAPRAALLRAAGVRSVAELEPEEPNTLSLRLAALAREGGEDPPRDAEVRVWVRAAVASGGRPAR